MYLNLLLPLVLDNICCSLTYKICIMIYKLMLYIRSFISYTFISYTTISENNLSSLQIYIFLNEWNSILLILTTCKFKSYYICTPFSYSYKTFFISLSSLLINSSCLFVSSSSCSVDFNLI